MKRRQVLVNGVHMGIEEYGEASSNTDKTLVLLHGFTGSASNWENLLTDGGEQGWRVIAIDMLGHGTSDAPVDFERYNMEHCQADILASLQQLGIQAGQAVLLGYSMGGRIALYCAYSGYFRALILESASPGLANPQERERRRKSDQALAKRIEQEGIEAFVNYWEKLPLFASQSTLPAGAWLAQRRQRLNNSSLGLANSLRGVGTGEQPALHAQLAHLDIPVLLLAGGLDAKFCNIAREMATQLPHAQLQIIANTGHTIHLEQPTRFKEDVCKFCADMLR